MNIKIDFNLKFTLYVIYYQVEYPLAGVEENEKLVGWGQKFISEDYD